MLKLAHDPQFEAIVGISIPGKKDVVNVEFHFKYMRRKELAEFLKYVSPSKSKDEEEVQADGPEPDEYVPKFVVGWNKKHIDAEFSNENLIKLIDIYPTAPMALLMAYVEEIHKSRVKN